MSNLNIASRFDEIYNSTSKAVLAFVTAKCRNTADISDILQETYLELYQVLVKRGANYITNDKTFVIRIAKHKIARHYSLTERLRNVISINASSEDEDFTLTDFDVNLFSMEDYAVNQVTLDQARKLIQSKSEVVEKIFYLFYYMDMTIPEIAKTLSMTESNVKQKLYRTLKELKKILE